METQRRACTLPDRERLILAYLGGTISIEDADRLEAHCMTCEECAAELEQGVAIRSARVATPSAPVVQKKVARTIDWRWLAAAASIVIVASIWKFAGSGRSIEPQPSPVPNLTTVPPPIVTTPAATVRPSPTRNGGDQTLRDTSSARLRPVATRAPNGEIRIEWPAVANATQYVLTISATDGSQLFKHAMSSTSIVIDAATSAFPGHVNEAVRGRVEAKNALGVTVATSSVFTIPARREKD